MDKTINVSLGGRNFVISEDGYNILHSYISNIKEYFKSISPENYQEIVDDFEMRIGELFSEMTGGAMGKVITRDNVASVIEQLGNVNDFSEDAGEHGNADKNADKSSDDDYLKQKPSKRLYRDTNNALLGGVLAGLAAYMGIDKSWFRLAIIILIFIPYVNFPFLFVYIVMWLIVPPARTVIEQMRMRGENLSADSIARNVMVDGSNETASNVARTIFKVFFFILMIPIAITIIFFVLIAISILVMGMTPMMIFFDAIRLPEEVFWGFPLVLLGILFLSIVVLLLVRLIYKGNVMRIVYVLLALFLIFGGSMLCMKSKMESDKGPFIVQGRVMSTPPAQDDLYRLISMPEQAVLVATDTVKFTVKSSEGYEQVRDNFSVKDKLDRYSSLMEGKATHVFMSTLYNNGSGQNFSEFQAWEVTDGWFGYLGATEWKSKEAIVCVKPSADGTFYHISCKPESEVGLTPSVTLRYVNSKTMKCVDIELYVEIIE